METTGQNGNNDLLARQATPATVDLKRFPPFKRNHHKEIAPQIAHHLALLMGQDGSEMSYSVRVPAAMTLCSFYQCTPLDVLDGLYAFRQKNYEYVMNGLDSDITLQSHPQNLKARPKRQWQGPWELTHKIAESPFINLFQGKAG